MKLATKAYGSICVEESNRITMVKPILGFEDFKNYFLIEVKEIPSFYWLQSEDDAQVAFMLVDPRIFVSDYVLSLSKEDQNIISSGKDTHVIDFVIANVPANIKDMTINLLGPVVINVDTKQGIQAISTNDVYETKHAILEMKRQVAAL